MQRIYKRICPKCNQEVIHKNKLSFKVSEEKNKFCSKCSKKYSFKGKLTDKILKDIKKLTKENKSTKYIAKELNLSTNTVVKGRKKLKIISPNYSPKVVIENYMKCSTCFISFPKDEFHRTKNLYNSFCKKCQREKINKRLNENEEKYIQLRVTQLKARSKQERIDYNLDINYVLNLFYQQNKKCLYTNENLKLVVGKGSFSTSLSFDRINPQIGYVKGNVVLCTKRANAIKYDQTLIEFRKWMPSWYKNLLKNKKKLDLKFNMEENK